jgi:Baseplate J-like protein
MSGGPPLLDSRSAADFVSDLVWRRPGFVPGWLPTGPGPGNGIVQVYGRYLETLASRLDQAPDKNKLAFLDQLGVSLLPAQAARAPVVFTSLPGAPAGRVAARTRLGATAPGGAGSTIFETEHAIGVVTAKLTDVATIWPGRDAYADHSSAATAGEQYTLFQPLAPIEHTLYLAHDVHFALSGRASVELRCELSQPAAEPLAIVWEYWDGAVWRGFKDFKDDDVDGESLDGTDGLSRSGIVRLAADCAATAKTTVSGIETFWIRGRLDDPLPPQPGRTLPIVRRIDVRTVIDRRLPSGDCDGLQPEAAIAGGLEVDLSKTLYPFGQQPQPGDVLYLAAEEALTKPLAVVTLCTSLAELPQTLDSQATPLNPEVWWEYWNGRAWTGLTLTDEQGLEQVDDKITSFQKGGRFAFTVPLDIEPVSVEGKQKWWVRARLVAHGYGGTRVISYSAPAAPNGTFTFVETLPPALETLRLGYLYASKWASPQHCLAHNDFAFHDATAACADPGLTFVPFAPTDDTTPAVYLGFDHELPVDLVSLYFAIGEDEPATEALALLWEYWDGAGWRGVAVKDETAQLSLPGMIALVGLEDSAPLARFGTARFWLRARLREDGPPVRSQLTGPYPNAVWAEQAQTITGEILGSGNGEPDQAFFVRQAPVLESGTVEIRELEGARAEIELPILRAELVAQGLSERDLRSVVDPRTGRIVEAWVRWSEKQNLLFSGPDDRHYTVERSRGRVSFGARPVPPGQNNVLAGYRAGGGLAGNVAAGAINQLLGAAGSVQSVTNPRAAEGGADGESPSAVLDRGPHLARHRRQAVSLDDVEALAREASPAVAVVRALAATGPDSRPMPGWISLVIAPWSQEPRPWPSFELRRTVRDFLVRRVPATAMRHLSIRGPHYRPIGVDATVTPVDPEQAGPVGTLVQQTLAGFLHPLTGGPDKRGWSFGRDVYLSDVAAALERVPGLDYVSELVLTVDGTLQAERVRVPSNALVAAAEIHVRVELATAES